MSDDTITAELFGGPKDGEEMTLDRQVPRELVFPVGQREGVYRFSRQMGQRTVRYEWDGTR